MASLADALRQRRQRGAIGAEKTKASDIYEGYFASESSQALNRAQFASQRDIAQRQVGVLEQQNKRQAIAAQDLRKTNALKTSWAIEDRERADEAEKTKGRAAIAKTVFGKYLDEQPHGGAQNPNIFKDIGKPKSPTEEKTAVPNLDQTTPTQTSVQSNIAQPNKPQSVGEQILGYVGEGLNIAAQVGLQALISGTPIGQSLQFTGKLFLGKVALEQVKKWGKQIFNSDNTLINDIFGDNNFDMGLTELAGDSSTTYNYNSGDYDFSGGLSDYDFSDTDLSGSGGLSVSDYDSELDFSGDNFSGGSDYDSWQ